MSALLPPFSVVWRAPRAWFLGGLMIASATAGRAGQGDPGGFSPDAPAFDRVPIFFPPHPPPLGRPVLHSPAAANTGAFAAPPEMAGYVNEVFYPPLATRLAIRELPDKLRREVEDYRAARRALQKELKTELDRPAGTDPVARDAALSTLARAQAPKLVQLETTAEHLRRALMASDQRWGDFRDWHLGDNDRRGYSPVEIAEVMRAYAFYDTELLPAQRRLLCVIALELLYAGDNATNAAAQQPYVFFSPEPARVLFPDNLPLALAKKISVYETKQAGLKKELYDAVYARDGARLAFLRGHTLAALASQQAPRLTELDTLAEDIRRDLAAVGDSTRRTAPPLTADMMARVEDFYGGFTRLQKETAARIDAILADARELPMQCTYRFDPDGLKFIVVPTRGVRGNPELAKRIEAVRTAIAALGEEYGVGLASFTNEKDALRSDITKSLGTTNPVQGDNLLVTAMRFVAAQATEDAYGDYRTAVFRPGLSPEQRRLLFDYALEHLDLPLPRGDWQPVRRGNSW